MEEVKNAVERVFCGDADSRLLLGVHDLIGAVSQQKLHLNVICRARDHLFCAQLTEKRGRFKRGLKMTAESDEAYVVIVYAE